MRLDRTGASDAELLKAGDADGFTLLYDRHVERLFSWARVRVGDHAADVTAEVFARAWLSRRSFRDKSGGSALPWLYGIAQHVLLDSLRKRSVEDRARARLGLPVATACDPRYEQVEQRLSLPAEALRAIGQLPPHERDLLDMRIVDEQPYDEIAERLQITPQAARLRVSRALRRLNIALGGQRK